MKLLRKWFHRYIVLDSYGTTQYCLTLNGAMSWIAYCSPEMVVIKRFNQRPIVFRNMEIGG